MTTMRVPRRQRLQIAVHQYQHALYNAAIGLVLQHMQKEEIQQKETLEVGVYNTLMKELEDESDKEFQSFARVPPDLYHEIVRRVGPRIQKQHTFFRKALSPGLKVAITLRFLGTGISYHSLAHEFRCPQIPSAWSSLRLVRPSLLNTWRSRLNVQKHQRSGKEWHEDFQRDGTYTTFVGH